VGLALYKFVSVRLRNSFAPIISFGLSQFSRSSFRSLAAIEIAHCCF
jgi:hypothetical protein